jgi:hypothetical protein
MNDSSLCGETKPLTMKKIILIFALFAAATITYGQSKTVDTTKNEYKNVIGIDATGLIHQIFNSGSVTESYFTSPYIITYRRIFANNALRIGVGGKFYYNDGSQNDSNQFKHTHYSINAGIGYERYVPLGKRWKLFLGADAIVNYGSGSDRETLGSSYFSNQSSSIFGFGVSPFLGIDFKINKRLSIATESDYAITYYTSKSKRIVSSTPDDNSESKSSGISAVFYAPIAINFKVHF